MYIKVLFDKYPHDKKISSLLAYLGLDYMLFY